MTAGEANSLLNGLTADGAALLSIGGERMPASDRATMTVLDPSTAEPLAEVASASVDDAFRAVTAAYDGATYACTVTVVKPTISQTKLTITASQATIPSPNTSARGSTSSPRSCSGAE